MRLIDADALKEKAYPVTVKNEWHMHESIDVVDVEDIDKMPTIDDGSGSHGKWIRTGRSNIYGGTELECNLCKDRVMVQDVRRERYCRNCGARMENDYETD